MRPTRGQTSGPFAVQEGSACDSARESVPKAKRVAALAFHGGDDVLQARADDVAFDDALTARRWAPLEKVVVAHVQVLLQPVVPEGRNDDTGEGEKTHG